MRSIARNVCMFYCDIIVDGRGGGINSFKLHYMGTEPKPEPEYEIFRARPAARVIDSPSLISARLCIVKGRKGSRSTKTLLKKCLVNLLFLHFEYVLRTTQLFCDKKEAVVAKCHFENWVVTIPDIAVFALSLSIASSLKPQETLMKS